MLAKGINYVGSCPQCRRGLDGSLNRMVTDDCGHSKCRFCLLQEMNGCLKCCAERSPSNTSVGPPAPPQDIPAETPPQRKSVIMGPPVVKNEQQLITEKSTERVLQQSMQKEILFPTEIVKKSAGGFFHLKRVISERYYNEGKEERSAQEKESRMKLPRHIVHYCEIHGVLLRDEAAVERHTNCKANSCDICNKTFSGLAKLQKHRRSHRQRQFTCSICSKHFRDSYARSIHKRIHTGVRAYKCDICHVELKQLYGFKRHMALHKGEKKFGCDKCEYRALTRGELNKHLKTHGSKKAFTCNVCGMKFSFKRTMLRHSQSHDPKASPLQCSLCGATFKRKDNLIRHQKNAHQGTKPPISNPQTPSSMTTVFEFDQSKIKP